jgi:hypothetical protein
VKARRVTAGIRARLEQLEGSELESSSELQVVLCWLVLDDIPIDTTVLLFTFALSVSTPPVFGRSGE